MRQRTIGLFLSVIASCALVACRPGGVTDKNVAADVARTFANLIRVQERILGGPPVEPAALHATAACQKVGLAGDVRGAGTWRCTITWLIPGHPAPVHDTYELAVTPDGCYTATADGTEAHLGGPTLKTRAGVTVTNLLYAFDGCFDPR